MSFIRELQAKSENYGLDYDDRIGNILESVIYHGANAEFAREELDEIWNEMELEVDAIMEVTDVALSAKHPSFVSIP
ncbi:MAG: hypothetical protein NZ730_06545 [Porticoccaceae bacterium]|nr:hypothetical protein [Porticoccaceae bacterium]